MERDYAFEALAEVTSTDWNVGRGELNAALKQIREQAEESDSYLLGAEIHERAKMYRFVYASVALTPTALAKHWQRVKAEAKAMRRGGTNLHVGASLPTPPPARERNLEEARKLMQRMGWS